MYTRTPSSFVSTHLPPIRLRRTTAPSGYRAFLRKKISPSPQTILRRLHSRPIAAVSCARATVPRPIRADSRGHPPFISIYSPQANSLLESELAGIQPMFISFYIQYTNKIFYKFQLQLQLLPVIFILKRISTIQVVYTILYSKTSKRYRRENHIKMLS